MGAKTIQLERQASNLRERANEISGLQRELQTLRVSATQRPSDVELFDRYLMLQSATGKTSAINRHLFPHTHAGFQT